MNYCALRRGSDVKWPIVGIQGDNGTRVAYNGINYEERRTSR